MKKLGIICIYLIAFWIVLPILLIGSGQFLDNEFQNERIISDTLHSIGVFLVIISILFLVISIHQFRKFGRELPISASPPKTIIRGGLFSVWRHPIYLFYTLLFIGIGCIMGSRAMLFKVMPIFLAVLTLYVFIEEHYLKKRFGENYTLHVKHTPLLIPKLNSILKVPFYLLFKILFVKEVKGRENIPFQTPFIVISSHRNYLDPFLISVSIPYTVNWVTTYEMYRNQITRFFLNLFCCIPKKRYLNDYSTAKTILKRLKNNQVIGIFPEGERSWTGSVNSFKPETINLLKKLHNIPVLPVKLEGNYLTWPRWAKNVRKGKISVRFMPALQIDSEIKKEELEALLTTIVQPNDRFEKGFECKSDYRVENVPLLFYRCPVCHQFETLKVISANKFECSDCKASFFIDSHYRIQYQSREETKTETIPEFYEKIRVKMEDIFPIKNLKSKFKTPEVLENSVIAYSDNVEFFEEKGTKFKQIGSGEMLLSHNFICFLSDENVELITLEELGAVTMESNYKMQLYSKGRRLLFQAVFKKDSAKKWQDYIIETIRLKQIPMPVTR